MVTISACMIVKNEENVIERCLNSLKDLVDEIIIVDTGSIDKTKEIAAKYTDKIYDFAWNKDFASARNFSFSKATMDYIYCADADEVIDEKNRKKFLDLKNNIDEKIEIVQMLYTNQMAVKSTYNFDSEHRAKLYKRIRNFMWINPIHETVCIDPVIFDSDIEITHLPEKSNSKRDFSTFLHHFNLGFNFSDKTKTMYAKELYICGDTQDFLDAEKFFIKILDESPEVNNIVQEALCILVKTARIKNDSSALLKYCLRSAANNKLTSEICCELGSYYYEIGDYNEAFMWFYNALNNVECCLNILYKQEFPLKKLMDCCKELKDEENYKFFETEYKKKSILSPKCN